MSQSELLILTIKALEESKNEYMLTGSLVSSIQGEPRATHDIDIIVTASPLSIEAFLKKFHISDYYYDIEAAKAALSSGGMFNILSTSGDKIDIWALTDSPFDHMRFSRRQKVELFGLSINVSSPEDTILMKLLWSKQCGGSQKQLFDAAKVYSLQEEVLDLDYFKSWISELDLKDEHTAMQRFL